jgi:hypothetical protein
MRWSLRLVGYDNASVQLIRVRTVEHLGLYRQPPHRVL